MLFKKAPVKKQPLDGFCSKDEQIDMLRTMYSKAAKERDEATKRVRELEDENKKLRGRWFMAMNGYISLPRELLTIDYYTDEERAKLKELLFGPTPPTGGSGAQDS